MIRHEFTADAPNELWLADITEHWTDEGKLYLCAIKDVFSNRIVGYSIDSRMKSRLAVAALEQRRRPPMAVTSPAAWSTPTAGRRADSTGRRNTSMMEVCDGASVSRQQEVRAYRGRDRVAGSPTVAGGRIEVAFWAAIAEGLQDRGRAARGRRVAARSGSGGSATLAA